MDPESSTRPSSRRNTSLCKCRSHCTTYNARTRTYEGAGNLLTRSTRNNHSKDDRILSSSSTSSSSAGPLRTSKGRSSLNLDSTHDLLRQQDVAADLEQELRLIAYELTWYGELPLTSPSIPLVFINRPVGDYHWPAIPTDNMRYNLGLYALVESHRANAAFLSAERRLCEIYANLTETLDRHGGTHDSNQVWDVFDLLHEEVSRMCKEKEYHWAQQRFRAEILVNSPTHATLFNNGTLAL